MEKKIILEQKDYQLIIAYIRSMPVSFDNLEMAIEVKNALKKSILADVSYKETKDNNQP